ncbi:MAG: Gfo/Idh/MocA family oxidoreductase, partial [Propionibacteriaceae bacterium]|nr:Gfo/Idh/MocA family oxidoreductase [Propionibacteriaceae bacterium]
MTDSPTRVGILGFGVSGSVFHAPTVSATPGFELVAVATDFPGHQVKLRTQYPQTKLYSDSEEFFADVDDFDLVVVSVTNNLHFDYGMRLVEAGIPAIVEKPLSSTSEKARKLVAEAQEKNAFLTVFQNRR